MTPPEPGLALALTAPWLPERALWIADSTAAVAALVADGIPRGSIFRWREVCELVGAEEPTDVLRRLLSQPPVGSSKGVEP